ncbi:helix-turn-helix domain-containing protein [Chryseobacterium sp. JK1]|uniref:helix-turn-helix domain-containing protein n=1 Tax=Chryseobacterium sp. JK1 TaxID=874294 RepID=UPI003D68BDC6
MKKSISPYHIQSIQEFHSLMQLPEPKAPLISLVRFEDIKEIPVTVPKSLILPFFSLWLKKDYHGGRLKYGQQIYDFDAGSMSFFESGQFFTYDEGEVSHRGWWLMIAPEFILKSPLASTIRQRSFFSYSIHEALHLSDEEEMIIDEIMQKIDWEITHSMDDCSSKIIISYVELLLNYAERFYNRQFMTRKTITNELVDRLNRLLDDWINNSILENEKLPSVKAVSQKLNVSTNYLSDMLKGITGKTTLQHIHDKLIETAKIKLSTTNMTISEISYELGFEHPQSFAKLFKNKTNISPNQFRRNLQ